MFWEAWVVPFAPKNGLFYVNLAFMFKFGSNTENFDQKRIIM